MKARFFNWLFGVFDIDRGDVSDGYHTFNELYEHRCLLWIVLTNKMRGNRKLKPWKTLRHSDGCLLDNWFVLGVGEKPGEQITYHLPMRMWSLSKVKEIDIAPEFDGHTPIDTLERLKRI